MSTHIAEVVTYSLAPCPNSDNLSIATIKGWQCVVKTESFKSNTSNLAVYIPIDMIAPKDHPLLGFLEGKRVKTKKLRGALSQGVLLPLNEVVKTYPSLAKKMPVEGDDLSTLLEVTRWEEPETTTPTIFGKGQNSNQVSRPEWLSKYTDIENYNNWTSVILEGEGVEISCKMHGACTTYALVDGEFYISSRNRCLRIDPLTIRIPVFNKKITRVLKLFKLDSLFTKAKVIPPEDTVWHRIYYKYNIKEKLTQLSSHLESSRVAIYGELVNIQKGFTYGCSPGEVDFYVFDIRAQDGNVPTNCTYSYLSPPVTTDLCEELGLKHVPVFKVGPFHKEDLELRNGPDPIGKHIREGIVLKLLHPRVHKHLGRVILKRVSEDYLIKVG